MKMLSCRESSKLLSERMERPLRMGERLTLRFHTMMCKACTRVEAQLLIIRKGVAEYPVPKKTDSQPPPRQLR